MSAWRPWLPLVVSVIALTLALIALAVERADSDLPAAWTAIPEVVEARMTKAERGLREREVRALEALEETVPPDADRETLLAALSAAHATAVLEAATARLAAEDARLADRATAMTAVLGQLEERVGRLLAWKAQLEAELAQLRAALAAGQAPEPPPAAKPPPPADVPEPPGRVKPAEPSAREEKIADLRRMLRSNRDFYARLGAATALGELRAADAVPDLIAAIDDRDELVRTAASEALHRITGHDILFVSVQPKRERLQVVNRWRVWWKHNEAAVRARLANAAK